MPMIDDELRIKCVEFSLKLAEIRPDVLLPDVGKKPDRLIEIAKKIEGYIKI